MSDSLSVTLVTRVVVSLTTSSPTITSGFFVVVSV